MSITFTLRVG